MIMVMKCSFCGAELMPVDAVTLEIKLSAGRLCEHCNNTDENHVDLIFCSVEHFDSWLHDNPGDLKKSSDELRRWIKMEK